MVRAWYMDDIDEDQRLEHHLNPPQFVSIEELTKLTGVQYWKLDPVNYEQDGSLDKIRKERGYSYMDEVQCSRDHMEDYFEKLKMFFQEHIHSDEEIRFVTEGSGYFDVRDTNDRWIRVHVVPGDLITLPSGIYHRFTLDEKNYIRAKRLFVGEPIWTPINRPAEQHPARIQYVEWAQQNAA